MPARKILAVIALAIGLLFAGALIMRTKSAPISPSVLDKPPSDDELRSLRARAERGDLSVAEGLRGHYCLFTDDTDACEYWIVRIAELGSEEERCGVISQFDEFKSYSQFADRIAALKARGHCATPSR